MNKKFKLTLLKDLPEFPAGTEVLNVTEDMLSGKEQYRFRDVEIFALRDDPEWVRVEEDLRCDCETKEYLQFFSEEVGNDRSASSYIDFEEKIISTHYDYACDQGHDHKVQIKFCPFCGREL
jgi:hypothetical protein